MPAPFPHEMTPVVQFHRTFDSKQEALMVMLAQYVVVDERGKRVVIAFSDQQLEQFFAGVEKMRANWEAQKTSS
jgi:hypothetical protein